MNIFEKAIITKHRITTPKGRISPEDLNDLPVATLNDIAMGLSKKLKEFDEESFIKVSKSPLKDCMQLSFDLTIHFLNKKVDEQNAQKIKAKNKKELELLTHALAEKRDSAISAMTEEEIMNRMAELGGEE